MMHFEYLYSNCFMLQRHSTYQQNRVDFKIILRFVARVHLDDHIANEEVLEKCDIRRWKRDEKVWE